MSKPPDRSADRHKPAKMVRIRAELHGPLATLAARRASDVTQVVNESVRKELEAERLWPPADLPLPPPPKNGRRRKS